MAESKEPKTADIPDVPGISRRSMEELPFSLVVADMRLPDNPLVYVNPTFERTTGYQASAVIGRNCRFLQGPDTETTSREVIRNALNAGEEASVDIINYRADGEKFVNRLLLSPLHDEEGNVTHFLGIQSHEAKDAVLREKYDEVEESMRELRHRVKNHLSMLLSLVRLQAANAPDLASKLDVLAGRVRALSVLYDDFARVGDDAQEVVSLGAYLSRLCGALNMLDGRGQVLVNFDAAKVECGVDKAGQIGMLVSELLTNAMQHAFDDDQSGTVEVELELRESGETLRLAVCDDGRGLPEGSNWPDEGNLGANIVKGLVGQLSAEIDVESDSSGTRVELLIPMDGPQD